jgi:hypothetical protein
MASHNYRAIVAVAKIHRRGERYSCQTRNLK